MQAAFSRYDFGSMACCDDGRGNSGDCPHNSEKGNDANEHTNTAEINT